MTLPLSLANAKTYSRFREAFWNRQTTGVGAIQTKNGCDELEAPHPPREVRVESSRSLSLHVPVASEVFTSIYFQPATVLAGVRDALHRYVVVVRQ